MKLTALLVFLISLPALAQFSHESELSNVKTGGNSEVQTLNTKTLNTFKRAFDQFRFGGHYTYGESNGGVSARNWDVNGRYEHEMTPKLSYVIGEIVEGNQFVGINARYNSDAGAKYYMIKTDAKNFFTELAYRYAIEDRKQPLPNTYDNKARFFNEFNHKYSETFQYRFWLEYVPNFTESKDYLINGEASITSILTSVFSIKVAYLGMYDNQPAFSGFKNYDYTTSTSLVAKF